MKRELFIALAFVSAFNSFGDKVRFSAQVLDAQTGNPVSGAEVSAGFKTDNGFIAKDRYSYEFKRYVVDSTGRAQIQGQSNTGDAGATVVIADGYYCPAHCEGPRFKSKNFFGVWQPDNLVVTIKLQRVEHPIPLWVKNVQETGRKRDLFQEGNGRIQFDFLAGDWLPPVGKGKVADVEFVRLPHEDFGEGENDGIKANSYRNSMSVKFLGADNGLLEMSPEPYHKLKIRTAPESGYRPEYFCWKGRSKKLVRETSYDKDRCFCFRVRTRRNADGTIREAYYGKIYGDIIFGFKNNPFVPVATVQMLYYLNPTSLDRNLEWDRKTNLCPNPGDVGHSVGDRQP